MYLYFYPYLYLYLYLFQFTINHLQILINLPSCLTSIQFVCNSIFNQQPKVTKIKCQCTRGRCKEGVKTSCFIFKLQFHHLMVCRPNCVMLELIKTWKYNLKLACNPAEVKITSYTVQQVSWSQNMPSRISMSDMSAFSDTAHFQNWHQQSDMSYFRWHKFWREISFIYPSSTFFSHWTSYLVIFISNRMLLLNEMLLNLFWETI